MAGGNVNRRLNIYINDREVTNSLTGIDREMRKVSMQMKNLNAGSENYAEELARLGREYNQLSASQTQFKNEINGVRESMDTASESAEDVTGVFSKMYAGLMSGNLKDVQEGFGELTTGIKNAAKAGWTFVSTPIGAAIAVLAGIAMATKALFDYNAELSVMNKKLESLGVAKPDMSSVRSEIQATANTFDKSFDEIAEKANSLSKTYKISMTEANDIIARGLANGGSLNDEFLNSLGEYDEFFAKAGYSAQRFSDIINTGYENGSYADKLPDALKEADLALKEQTKTTRDALVNAFGASFSDEILTQVSSGELTTSEALDKIATKAEKSQLNQQQLAQLTADVFKGAGEDAGGAAVIFDLLAKSSTRAMSEGAIATDQLRLANERLAKAQASLFEVSGFTDGWTKFKAVALDAVASVMEEFADFKNDIQPLIDLIGVLLVGAFVLVKNSVITVWEVVSGSFRLISNAVSGFVQFFKKLFQGDFKGAIQVVLDTFVNFGRIIANVFIGINNTILGTIVSLVDKISPVLKALGIDVDNLKKKLEGWKSQKFELRGEVKVNDPRKPTNGDAPVQQKGSGTKHDSDADKQAKLKAAEDHKKLLEQQLKEREDLEKQLLATQRAAQDAQLALMVDGYAKEQELINLEYDRKIEDLKAQMIKESEIKNLQNQIQAASSSGNTNEATRLQALLNQKLEINKAFSSSMFSVDQARHLKLATLQEKHLQEELKKEGEAHQRALKNLKTKQAFELQDITSFQQAKAFLSQTLSSDELKHVRTLEQAKALIKKQHLQEQYEVEKAHLEATAQKLQEILNNNGSPDFQIFSDEERDKVLQNLEDVHSKISGLTNPKEDQEEEKNAFDGAKVRGVDILGFDAGKWEVLFEGIDTFKEKIQAVQMVAGAMQNAFSQYFAFMEAGENRALAVFQKNNEKRKSELSTALERGYINQEVYNARVAKSEEELNRKKSEIEYKQAKRKKAMSIVETIVNTATAIMQAYAQLGPIGGSIAAAVVGTMGALQIATIAKQPLPEKGYKVGGYTGKGNSNEADGIVHKNEYVIPADVLQDNDPRMPVVMDYLESKRLGRKNNSVTNNSINGSEDSQSVQANDSIIPVLVNLIKNNTSVMQRLIDGDITALVELDIRTAKKIRERINELEILENQRKK